MAVTNDKKNGIITLTAVSDEVSGDLEVEGVLYAGTAAGAGVLQDGSGNDLVSLSLTTAVLAKYIPLNRRVSGVVASTLAANTRFVVYLKKG